MDAFIDTARRRSPIRESMPVHVPTNSVHPDDVGFD
jgi:hypothetical protein